MEEVYSIVSLDDHYMVGGVCSGADFAQNMYGMYVRFNQSLPKDLTNLEVSAIAHQWMWKPLFATSMGHTPVEDSLTLERLSKSATTCLFRMTRDYKDAMVHTWKTFAPDMMWEDFRDSSLGFDLVAAFEKEASELVYEFEFSYEQLVEEPQVFLTKLVNFLVPRQDNPELGTFGQAKREVSFDIVDLVVQECNVRELRSEVKSPGLLDRVGIHKEFLSKEQAEEIDEFVASL
jgi:hypothetical protein